MSVNLAAIQEWCVAQFGTAFEMSVSGEMVLVHDRPRAMTEDERATFDAAVLAGTLPGTAWAQIRASRDALLAASDWTQNNDAPLTVTQRQAWSTYRQALRDLPQQFATADAVEWPDMPDFSAALTVEYNGKLCYSGIDVDSESTRRVYQLVLPDQPESLQATMLLNALSEVQAAVLTLLDPESDEAAKAQASGLIAANVQLKAAIDAIWAEGQALKDTNGW